MEDGTLARAAPDRRIAFLIDADNVSHGAIAAMLAELSRYGTANIRRAYGDWSAPGLKGWKEKVHAFAIRPIQQFSYSAGKNATDMALVIDAMELLYTRKLDAFCIASSDGDFTPLVMQLKANGHEVYGFGERKTPAPFVACTTFLYLDILGDPACQVADALEPRPSAVQPPAAAIRPSTSAARTVRPLAEDGALVAILRGAVEASAHEDGWAAMSAAGSAAKRQSSIDPRNYGMTNFPALFAAVGLFDIHRMDDGQGYLADRRNADRTLRPVR